jgi:hypothetical protein
LIGLTTILDSVLAGLAHQISGGQITPPGLSLAGAEPALLTLLPVVAVVGIAAMLVASPSATLD